MYVDHHDAAYKWAEGRRIAVNPTTGALQVFAVESLVEPALEQVRSGLTETSPASNNKPATAAFSKSKALFADLSDRELLSIGTPQDLLAQVRSICSEAELDSLQTYLPV